MKLLTTPDDLGPCQEYCEKLKDEVRRLQARLDDKAACHSERVEELQQAGAALDALRERHAGTVESAFKEGMLRGAGKAAPRGSDIHDLDAAWLASEAKAALERREP